jgi:peptidoglycan/LPS O-acetylase OafA/YrhL
MSFPITPVEGLIAGALAMGFLIGGLFFLKFWRRTRDALFLAFSGAFGLLALASALPVLMGTPHEERSGVYLIRLAAFLLIIVAVLAKNLRRRV